MGYQSTAAADIKNSKAKVQAQKIFYFWLHIYLNKVK